jgi:hypothetical protein
MKISGAFVRQQSQEARPVKSPGIGVVGRQKGVVITPFLPHK